MGKITCPKLQPFLTDPCMWQTDRQTDGWTTARSVLCI